MSSQQTVKAKIRPIVFKEENMGFHAQVRALREVGYNILEYWEEDEQEGCFYADIEGVLISGGEGTEFGRKFYDIKERKELEYGFLEASRNPDGTIEFFGSWYNGGCSEAEAVQSAIDALEAREANNED